MRKKILIIVLLGLILGGGIWGIIKLVNSKKEIKVSQDKYVAFTMEVYDTIQKNYWEKISDVDLSNLYLLAMNKMNNKNEVLTSKDKSGIEKLLTASLKNISGDDKKTEFCATLANLVLVNLQPFGRSSLYSEKENTALTNNVNNINPQENYLSNLGLTTGATDLEVKKAFEEKTKAATTSAEKDKIEKSYEVVKDTDNRKVYESSGVEPTIEWNLIGSKILHLHQTKFSPTTMEEFARVTAKVDNGSQLDTLIYDLRGNIGGDIDELPYFLGPFLGPDNYAYQFYQQGKKDDYKTLSGWMNSLVRYKKVIILIDENTQSTAEVMASVLKKYNVGIVLGTTTKGWGTIERVFPITNQISDNEKFSIFLVHHITLREDGQPIEGRGVEPVISIKDKNWQKELLERYNNPEIVTAIEGIYKGK